MNVHKHMNRLLPALLLFAILLCTIPLYSQIQPPDRFEVRDTPSDTGESLLVVWPVDPNLNSDVEYIVQKAPAPDGPWENVERFRTDKNRASGLPQYFGFEKTNADTHALKVSPIWQMREVRRKNRKGEETVSQEREKVLETFVRIGVSMPNSEDVVYSKQINSVVPVQNWFRLERINSLIVLIFMFFSVMVYISKAQRNPDIFLRKIPGIDAVEEAVGRATEMGKPILYSTGYYDITEISTICSVNILAHLARKVAQYDSRLIVPCKWPVAMAVCQEVVREAYINAGRPDAFNIHDIFFIAGEQFSYTIGVDSLMVRERPAANFFMGTFAAEALILAETGAATGAIQIAGTDSNYQIPFFVVACDYCLIGEELYAASAYLARNPRLIGSLKAQDAGKLILFAALIAGTIIATLIVFHPDLEALNIIKYFFTVR